MNYKLQIYFLLSLLFMANLLTVRGQEPSSSVAGGAPAAGADAPAAGGGAPPATTAAAAGGDGGGGGDGDAKTTKKPSGAGAVTYSIPALFASTMFAFAIKYSY